MSTTKVKNRYQVTIPKDVRQQISCQVGDSLEVAYKNGRIVMTPQQIIAKPNIAKLNSAEQNLLKQARAKIKKIGDDHINSVGLSKEEIRVAVKVGLIDNEEAWWYTEDWQKDEREATKDEMEGRTSGALEGEEITKYFENIRR